MSVRTEEQAPPGARTRRRRLLAVVVLLVVAVAAVVLVLGGRDDDAPSPAAAPADVTAAPTSAAPGSEAPPSASAETPTSAGPLSESPALGDDVVADELPPSLLAVALDGTAEVDDDISATLESVEAVQGSGVGPGNVAGPALRVTVRIENRSGGRVDLDGVVVSLASGEDRVPAPPVGDPSAAPFAGTVEPGEEAEGVYVFSLAEDARHLITVSVAYQAGAPIMVFTGSAD